MARYVRSSCAMLLGILFFLASLPLYESYSSRDVWGRWSYPFFGVLVVSTLVWFVLLIRVIQSTRRDSCSISISHQSFAFAIFFWGLAYLAAAIDSPSAAGRILVLNVVGSDQPVAAVLELVALWMAFIAAAIFVASRIPKALQNSGLLVATIAFLFIAGETFVRAKSILFPSTQGFPTYSGALWSRRYVEYNSLGFRDIEHDVDTRDRPRLLVVGDSYTFGAGVKEINNRFGEITAELLSEADGRKWEAINAGLGDTHTLQHIDFLKQTLSFKPDVVILLYVFNDIDYIAAVTQRSSVISGRGWVRWLNPSRILFLNSYLFQEIFVRLRKFRYVLKPAAAESSPYLNDSLLDRHLADVRRFVQTARAAGANVFVVPYDIHIDSNDVAAARYGHFTEAAREFELPLCSLKGVFSGVLPSALIVNSLDRHPNPIANRLVATRGAECIKSNILD